MMKQNWVKKADAASQAILVTSIITMGFTALASLITIPAYADDTDVVDIINITVPTACTMGGTIVTGQEHSTSMQPGTYEANIGKTTLTTYCNDPDGFSIYAIGFTGDQYSGTNHTKLVGNNASNTISTGLTTGSSTTDASSWAMKLTAVTGTYAPTIMNGTGGTENFTNYHVVPDTYTKVATFPSTTDAEGVGSTGSSLETTYAVYASLSQPADTYTGKVKYVLVHPSSFAAGNYSIVYNTNGGTGTNVTVNNIANYEPYTIAANAFTAPSGYQFAGWCTTNTSQYACTDGFLYQPGSEVTSLGTAGSTANLYAIWSELPTMQAFSASDAAALSIGDSTTLIDSRDGELYTVTRLADNKIWMTTNLNIAGGTTLNASDSNVPSDNYYTLPASSTSGFSSDTTAYVYNSGNTTSTCSSPGCYSYYSWLAATAGGKDSSGNAVSTNGYNAAYSICPNGWRLPTSTTSNASATSNNNWKTGDWYALATAYGANLESNYYSGSDATFYNNAGPGTTPNFLLTGFYHGGSFYDGGSYGYYWSSTAYSSTHAYNLDFNSGGVNSASSGAHRLGRSVRCVYGS